jgi:hypothetical protein
MDAKEILDAMGISEATLRKMASQLAQEPGVRKLFEAQIQDPAFQDSVDELYDELQEVFNHDKSPKSGGGGRES